ncbi:MAG: pitrilysin family protein [bacterium]
MQTKKIVLPNGIRLLLVHKADSLSVTTLVLVRAGLLYEDKRTNGISHFIEHMCFKGTKNWPKSIDLSREFESMAANYNAFTGPEYTGYYATVRPKHLKRSVTILADLYHNPLYDEGEMDRERGVIKEEIKMYADQPGTHIQEIFDGMLYPNQPAGWNIGGTAESVDKLKVADLIKYREKYYTGANTVIVIAGNFSAPQAKELITKNFGHIRPGVVAKRAKPKYSQTKPEVIVESKKIDQVHFALGFRSFGSIHKDRATIGLLGKVLGGGMSSRLFQRIRVEMGAAYYIGAGQVARTDHGVFTIYGGVNATQLNNVLSAVIDECHKLCDVGVGEKELQLAKDNVLGSLELGLETSNELASFVGYDELLEGKFYTVKQIEKEIEKVTVGDIKKLARKIMQNKSLNLAVLGPNLKKERFVRILRV